MSKNRSSFKMRKWTLGLFAALAVAAVACGAEASVTPASDGSQSAQTPATSAAAVETGATDAEGGLDEACVQRVLGRAATGFGDISAAERDAVFEQCSGTQADRLTRQFATGGAGNLLDNLEEACVTAITGSGELDLAQLTLEQRQELITECAPEGFQAGRGGFGGGRAGGDFAGPGDLLQGCVTDALGETPENLFGLTPEQLASIAAACGDELPEGFVEGLQGGAGGGFFGDGAGRPGGFGGGQPGVNGGRGGFGGIDFASECVTRTLGRTVTDRGDLTPAESQQIFAACF